MNLCFVLANPELGGGVKVVFQLAHLASTSGHAVEVHANGPRPAWTKHYQCHYRDRLEASHDHRPYDIVFATYYTTLPAVERMNTKCIVHFCQGYEGDLEHLAPERPAIVAEYKKDYPVMTVNPRLGRRMQREFGKHWRFVPPPRDGNFTPASALLSWLQPRRKPWIMIPGIFEAEVKGVRYALECITRLRSAGVKARVIRVSTLPQSAPEREICDADQFLHAVAPERVAASLQHCDLLLLGSGPGEGFGLPALEASAAGVPVIAFDLPAMRLIGLEKHCRVPHGDVDAMTSAALHLLRSRGAWQRTRKIHITRAERRFSPTACSRRLEGALQAFAKLSA